MISVINQCVRKYARHKICPNCVYHCKRKCIFEDNNDEDLCDYVVSEVVILLERTIKNDK